jgi:hypothetical protein
MMDLVNDPGSFVVGCGIGFFAGMTFRLAVYRAQEGWRKFKEAKELEKNGNNGPAHV